MRYMLQIVHIIFFFLFIEVIMYNFCGSHHFQILVMKVSVVRAYFLKDELTVGNDMTYE